jgi:hypothetical protein
MISGTPKECNTTMIALRKLPTAINKRYESCSAIDTNRIIISNSNCGFDRIDATQIVFYSCCYSMTHLGHSKQIIVRQLGYSLTIYV